MKVYLISLVTYRIVWLFKKAPVEQTHRHIFSMFSTGFDGGGDF